ncbi:MAG: Mu-like prophage major head subunit gpT family protein, partial [Minicystis sp.]
MTLNVQIPLSQQVSADANTALTAYAMDFITAYQAEVEPWAETYGRVRVGPEITTNFPMPVDAAQFKKLFADFEYRRLAAKQLQLTSNFWQDGVREEAKLIEAPDFLGWEDVAMNMAQAARQAPNSLVAEILQAGKTAACWEDATGTVKWFDAAHPNNPFNAAAGTYGNLHTSKPLTAANIDFAFQKFREIKAPDGKRPRGLRLSHIFVGADLERKALRLCNNERILVDSKDSADTKKADVERYNDIKELGLKVIVCDEFTDSGVWYPACIKPGKGVPWVIKRRVPGKPLPMPGQQGAPAG